jgi:hypothetical protein
MNTLKLIAIILGYALAALAVLAGILWLETCIVEPEHGIL